MSARRSNKQHAAKQHVLGVSNMVHSTMFCFVWQGVPVHHHSAHASGWYVNLINTPVHHHISHWKRVAHPLSHAAVECHHHAIGAFFV